MIGDGVTACSNKKQLQPRMVISLKEIRPKKGENTQNNRDLRFTNGIFYVRYKPSANKSFARKPFVICNDLLTSPGSTIRVVDYEDFLKCADKNEEMRWIVRNTTHSKELFEMARNNLQQAIPLMFDTVKYAKKVNKNEKELFGNSHKNIYDIFILPDLVEAEHKRFECYLTEKKDVKL